MKVVLSTILTFTILFAEAQTFIYNDSLDMVLIEDFTLPDSLEIEGQIINYVNATCGVLCIGGMLEFEVHKPQNFGADTILIIAPCLFLSKEDDLNGVVKLSISKFTSEEEECYFKGFRRLPSPYRPLFKTGEDDIRQIHEFYHNR